ANRYFFNRTGAVVTAGTTNGHFRRHRFLRSDEIVLREPHWLSIIDGGYVIRAILLHVDCALIFVVALIFQRNVLGIIQRKPAFLNGWSISISIAAAVPSMAR